MNKQTKRLLLLAFLFLFGVLTFKQVSAQTVTEDPQITGVMPTFYCLGPCPTMQVPTVAQLLPDDEPTPTEIPQETTPVPQQTITPAPLNPAPSERRRNNRRDEDRGLIKRLLRIIELLLRGQQPPQGEEPTPTLAPTEPVEPTDGVQPTEEVAPTEAPEPTEAIEPTTQPTDTPPPPDEINGGLLQRIIELLQQLMEMIRQLLGQPPSGGGGNPSPTNGVEPTEEVEPTEGIEPTQGGGNPTTAPQPTTGNPTVGPTSGSGDTTPPSAPTNLTAASASNTSIRLSWTRSTDNVAVTEYIVYRSQGNGSANTGINWNSKTNANATITGTTYTDTNLTPGTAYYYYVRAIDAAGNRSTQSNTAGVTLAAPAPAKNQVSGTLALSDGKSANLKIDLLPANNLTKPIQSQSHSKSYTMTNIANGKYVVRISYGSYADKTCAITFSKTTGNDKATCNATLKPK